MCQKDHVWAFVTALLTADAVGEELSGISQLHSLNIRIGVSAVVAEFK